MESTPETGAVCTSCGATLSASGDCLPCLLRAGLEETVANPAPPAFPQVFGDFEIARCPDGSLWELGRGAMGVTYRAVDTVLHRSVALKVIEVPVGTSGAGAAIRERFLREARAAAALRHTNIAGVFQFGAAPEAGRCYYAMELIEGETLAARVRRDGPLDVDTALDIALQVTAALVAAAQRGLIHRDLKPGNLMLTGGDPATATKLEVKVIDFGLAKAAALPGETDLTQGGFVGTPAFASPEQFDRGTKIDARADLYSLGVTLWFALTGLVPFSGRSIDELRDAQARAVLPLEHLAVRQIPAPVIALLRNLLAVDPARRTASARELQAALEACRGQLAAGRDGGARTLVNVRPPASRRPLAVLALVLAVAVLAGAAWWVPAQWRAAGYGAVLPPGKSIAVLPFANLSADAENAFFTDGVQEEILTDLAKVVDLKVISRTSVLPFKSASTRNLRTIAQELGVANIVEGSVQRAGSRIRVNAQLIDARTDTQLWGERYDRELADVFAIQSEIAQAIAAQLQAKLSPREKAAIATPPTTNLAAYDAYLRGQKLGRDAELTRDEAEMRQAVGQLEDATARDPPFFLAWFELARADLSLYWLNVERTPGRLERAEAAVQTARRLRPAAGESHLVEGMRLYWGHRDFAAAAAELQAAARLLPNSSETPYWLCLVLRRQGRWEESRRQIARAVELDPRNPEWWIIMAETDVNVYRYAEAARANDQALALDPQNLEYVFWKAVCARDEKADLAPMHLWLGSLPAGSEKWSNLAAMTATILALEERDYPAAARALAGYPLPTINDQGYVWPRAQLEGRIAALNGDQPAAEAAFLTARQSAAVILGERPRDAMAVMVLAAIDAALGHKEDALREGRQACAQLTVADDAMAGPSLLQELAMIYAQCGERDQAIATLRTIADKPAGPTYGDFRLKDEWNPLRGDARFEAMVAARAPKER